MGDNSWAQVILRQDQESCDCRAPDGYGSQVLGSGSEQGPVVDLWEPEDPHVPKQMRTYGPLAERGTVGAIRRPRPPPLRFCSVVNLELGCNQAMIEFPC